MTSPTPLDIALAYHRAWTSGDLDGALVVVADDVRLDTPFGPMSGAGALREFMGPFAASLTSSRVLAAYGDDTGAVLVYDCANPLVASAPTAETYAVTAGRITDLRIVFDRLPFALARGEVTPVVR